MSDHDDWTRVLDRFEARLDAVSAALDADEELTLDGDLSRSSFELPSSMPALPSSCVDRARALAARNADLVDATRERLDRTRPTAAPRRPAPARSTSSPRSRLDVHA